MAGIAFKPASHSDPVFPVFFALAFLLACAAALKLRGKPAGRLAILSLSVFAIMFALSGFTVTQLARYHYIILFPAIGLVLAAGLEFARSFSRQAVIAAFALALLSSLLVTLQYKADAVLYGGTGLHSDAIYALAGYLLANPGAKPVSMDWGFYNNLYVLTDGKVNAPDSFPWSGNPSAKFNATMRRRLSDPSVLYIFHAPRLPCFYNSSQFGELARSMNKTLEVEEVFCQRDGTPVYILYRAE